MDNLISLVGTYSNGVPCYCGNRSESKDTFALSLPLEGWKVSSGGIETRGGRTIYSHPNTAAVVVVHGRGKGRGGYIHLPNEE